MSACAVAVARALMKAELILPSVHYGTFSRVKRMSERVSELALMKVIEYTNTTSISAELVSCYKPRHKLMPRL